MVLYKLLLTNSSSLISRISLHAERNDTASIRIQKYLCKLLKFIFMIYFLNDDTRNNQKQSDDRGEVDLLTQNKMYNDEGDKRRKIDYIGYTIRILCQLQGF